jgi:hypothetical protein
LTLTEAQAREGVAKIDEALKAIEPELRALR